MSVVTKPNLCKFAIPRGWSLSCCSWISVDPFEYTWALQLMSLLPVTLPVTYVNYFPRGYSLFCLSGVKAWISHNPYEHTWALRSEFGRFVRVSANARTQGEVARNSLEEKIGGWTQALLVAAVVALFFSFVLFLLSVLMQILAQIIWSRLIYPLSFWIFRFDTDKQTNKQTNKQENWSSVE